MRLSPLPLVLALAACTSLTPPHKQDAGEDVGANTRFGTYLAARVADQEQDAQSATVLLTKVLEEDPGNPSVLQRSLIQALAAGRTDVATDSAHRLVLIRPGHGLAHLTLAVMALKANDAVTAKAEIDQVNDGPTVLIAPLLRAWVLAAQGDKVGALASISEMERRGNLTELAHFHHALLFDVLGEPNAAEQALGKLSTEGSPPLREIEAYANLLERLDRFQDAHGVYRMVVERLPDNPAFNAGFKRTEGPVYNKPKPLIGNGREGAAEALFGIGGGLSQDGVQDVAMVYLQLALALNPDHEQARLTLAELLITTGQSDQAVAVLNQVPRGSTFYLQAQLEVAAGLVRADHLDDGIASLKALALTEKDSPHPLLALGDLYREHERYQEAAATYTEALARNSNKEPAPRDWSTYFARGVCYERTQHWTEAQADLEQALALHPKEADTALVLNYLGYSWLDRGQEFPRARKYIERAAELRPNDGYIIDSLGWVQYRTGDYRTAVGTLERAVELKPRDATINDHLGDAYWKTGRRLQARFQWAHALTDEPDAEEEASLHKKLDFGLDVTEKVSARQEQH